MAKKGEVNVIVDAKNKSKGTFLEVKKDLRSLGDESEKGLGRFSKSFANADKVVFSFADRMKWVDKVAKRTLKGTAAAAGVYIGATLRDFSQLNDGISKVNTLYDQTSDSQKKMYQDAIKMFKLIPTNFDKITQGIYDTISAGADPKYATMFARKFGMAGVAGDAGMDVVTKAAMGTMNAYKAEAKDLSKILDLQFMTVKKGITSYDELASSLGTGVLASAESAGITMEELYGAIAMITKNAIPASIATSSLNQMFNKFTDTKVIKEFKKFGVRIQDAKKNTRPLIEIMKDLNAQFDRKKKTSEERKGFIKELVGSDQAARAIMPILSDLKEFQSILDSMDNSKGAMQDAYFDRVESIKTQIQTFWNGLKAQGAEQLFTLDPLMKSLLGPIMEKQKLEIEIQEIKDELEFEEDWETQEVYLQVIGFLEAKLDTIEATPVEQLRDALAESVKELEKLNPPLAKFLDTIGNFTLNFVGEEGKEQRKKAGGWIKGIAATWAISKGMRMFRDIFGKTPWEFGKQAVPGIFNLGKGVKGAGETLYLKSLYAKDTFTKGKNLKAGIYIPEGYEVGGEKFNEVEEHISNSIKNKRNKKMGQKINSGDEIQDFISKYQFKPAAGPITMQGVIDRYLPKPVNSLNLLDDLTKMNKTKQAIDNNISMKNDVKVEPPNVRVYINQKETPARVEVDYGKIEEYFTIQGRRHGRIV